MNIEEIDKWLDNEYGVSYTRLEKLHDFVIEQDLKHREEADKEIERLNNIIKNTSKELEILLDSENIELIIMQLNNIAFRLKEVIKSE